MKSNNKRNITVIIILIALTAHMIVCVGNINLMNFRNSTSDFTKTVEFILITILFTALLPLSYILLNAIFSKRPFWIYIILTGILSGSCFINNVLCKKLMVTKTYTNEELLGMQNRDGYVMQKTIEKILKKNKIYIAPQNVIMQDKIKILSAVYKDLNSLLLPRMYNKPQSDSVVMRIRGLVGFYFTAIPNDSSLTAFKKTFLVDKIIYSPDLKNFLAILTMKLSDDSLYTYGHLIVLGHKADDKVHFIAFKNDGNSLCASRQNSMYYGLAEMFLSSRYNQFGNSILQLTEEQIPPAKEFWIAPKVAAFLKCKGDTIYKETNSAYTYTICVYSN